MKPLCLIYFLIICIRLHAQVKDSTATVQVKDSTATNAVVKINKPEVLTGGFIDIVQSGQMNASARLFKLYIGEPGKFQVPVSVYTGVTANNVSYDHTNEEVMQNLINPGIGIFNLSFDGQSNIIGNKSKITSVKLLYQSAYRVIASYNRAIDKSIALFNNIETAGIGFYTGAWERNKTGNVGVFWINSRVIFSASPQKQLNELFVDTLSSKQFGYSLGMGIEINQSLNIKVFYYRYFGNPVLTFLRSPFFQASFNYTMR